MNKPDASKLVAMLVAAYPRGPWPPETTELYERELAELDRACAGAAIRNAIRTCKFSPTIAEILDLYYAEQKDGDRKVRLLEEHQAWERGDEVYRDGKWQRKELPALTREASAKERAELSWKIAGIGKGDAGGGKP